MTDVEAKFSDRFSLVEQAIVDHGDYLRAYLCGLAGRQDGEELFDDLWVFVLNRFPEEKINHLGFLRRKAYQLWVDHWRKQKARGFVMAVEEPPEAEMGQMSSEKVDFTQDDDEAFKKDFFDEYPDVELSDDQKTALWLWARYGYTHVEVGKIMGKASSTVGDWIAQAKKAFAEALNNT